MRSSRYNGGPHGVGSCDSAHSAAERSYPTSEVRGRSGRTPCPRGSGQEELPHVRGQGQQPRVPCCDGAGMAERSYPTSEVRGGGREELPHIQGQGRHPRGATPPPRSGGREGTGGSRGATPCSRSGGAAVRRYPSSKVRSSGCACWSSREEIPHAQGKRNPSKMVGIARGHLKP